MNLASLHIEQAVFIPHVDERASRTRLNKALENLNKALEIQPGSPLAHYLCGIVYYVTGFDEESESHLKTAITNGGRTMAIARLVLADIHMRLKEWDGVVVQLDDYLDEYPLASNRIRVRSVRNAAAEKLAKSTP